MSATHQMIDGLERLRQAAIGGDLTAGNRALTVVDHLEKKSTMPRSTVRAARCLALEAQGWSLRNAANMMLVRAQAVAELFGVTVERERLAATLTERLDEWKRACDALVDECLARGEANDGVTAAATLYMRSHLHLHEVLAYVRVASWDEAFKAQLPIFVLEGLARARGAREAWTKLGIDEMRLKSQAIEMEWLWVGGDHAKAREVAEAMVRDPKAQLDPFAVERAHLVLKGESPLQEYEAIKAL